MSSTVPKVRIPGQIDPKSDLSDSVGVADQLSPQQVVDIAVQHRLFQLVQSSHPQSDSELLTAELMLTSPDLYLNCPIASILNPSQTNPEVEKLSRGFERTISKGSEKRELLHDFENYLSPIKMPSSTIRDAITTADELLSNAIFNAPHVSINQNGSTVPRTKEYGDAEGLRSAKFYAGHNNVRLAIACEDSYGTLNPEYMLNRLKKCFQDGADQAINWSAGGAGIGTFLIFQFAMAFYIAVEPNKRTIVSCTFPMGRLKDRALAGKNLHVMWKK